MDAGDIICLEHDIAGRGILPSHLRDLSDMQFNQHYGTSKEEWFIKSDVAAMVYIRPTTKKHGRTRSLIAPDRGKNSQLAVFDDEIFGVGSYEFTAIPERWVPIWNHTADCAAKGGPLKPVKQGDIYTAWSPQIQEYLHIPTRWQRNLMFCRPYDNPKWEDFEMELLPAAPGVNGANFRVNGGGSKTGRPKLGAGVRLFNAQAEPNFPECHDNKYLKHHTDKHPREADEWYVPWGEFRPKFRWWSDGVTKGSLTINFPVTGIGKLITGIEKPPRGRVTTPRPQENHDDYYHPMIPSNPFGNPARAQPYSTTNTPNNYYPQGNPPAKANPFAPSQPQPQHPGFPNPKAKKVDELMKKLMRGETLTTEELMLLQRWD